MTLPTYRKRPSVIRLNDKVFIRASSLSGCLRKLSQELDTMFNGTVYEYEPPSQALLDAAQYGIENEDRIIEEFVESIGYQDDIEKGKKVIAPLCDGCSPSLFIEGHVDAMIGDFLVEVKTVSGAFRASNIRYRWIRQISAYMVGIEHMFGVQMTPVLLEHHRDTGETHSLVLDSSELLSKDELHALLHSIVDAAQNGELAPCECGYCKDAKTEVVVDVSIPNDAIVDRLIEIDEEMERLKQEREALLRRLEDAYGHERVAGNRGYVVWVEATKAKTFDTKRHEAEHPDCHMLYMTERDRKPYAKVVRKVE